LKRITIVGIAIAVILVAVIAFFVISPGSNTKGGDNLVVAIWAYGGEPSSLDPIYGWNLEQEPLIQSRLFKRDHDMKLENDLGTGYKVSDDEKTYTVSIRDGVKFHDGSNLTADDVVFTFDQATKVGKSTADLTNLNETTATNSTEIKFVLNKPDSTFLSKLTMQGIVPKASYNNETYATHPIGSGPFKFVQWDKGQQIMLERNDEYYGKKPSFKNLTITYLQGEAALNAVSNGEVDIAEISPEFTNRSLKDTNIQSYKSVDPRGISLPTINNSGEKTSKGIDIGNNVTANLAIRKALNYGLNRDEIVKGPLFGYGDKSYDGVSTILPWNNPDSVIKDGDINEAKKILSDDGWRDSDGDGIVEKNGLKAEFDLIYHSSDSVKQAMAVTIAEQAKNFGIKINPQGKSWDEMSNFKFSNAVINGYGSRDPSELKSDYYSKLAGKSNTASYNNSAVDKHIESATTAHSENESYKDWKSVLWDGSTGISPKGDSPWVWIATLDYTYYVRNNLDLSTNTATVPTHGGDLFGNICDWKRK
jgi:peptide/nickel transport system substrate-binding protein